MNWEQLKTIVWLRWRLTRNQWARSGGLGAILAAVVAVATCVLGVGSFVGALLGGILGLGEAKAIVIWGVWFGLTVGFLFLWLIGLVNELQRSETIDLQRLMHLPVALGQLFVVNYVASHFAFSLVLFVPAMMGLALGLGIGRGPTMLLLVPLALGMIFMITAWTYCLRGWLATLMSNPRRRRTVIMGITVSFILLAQGPNLYFNVFRRLSRPPRTTTSTQSPPRPPGQETTGEEKFGQLLAVQKFIPPLWLPVGARALAERRVGPALLGTFGCVALGAFGLRRAYRATLRFYHGETGGGAAAAPTRAAPKSGATTTPAKTGSRFLELRIPAVPEQAAALAMATFRSMLRAPEVKMAWGSSLLVTLVVGGLLLFRSTLNVPDVMKPFLATAGVVFSVFMLVQFLTNQFGFDRDGFRALILSPADRRLILLGKNLACLPVGVGFGLLLLALLTVGLHLSATVFAATLFQLVALFLLASLVGNGLSIFVPYRIQSGSMKPTKMPGLALLVMMLCQMLFPLAMTPVFLPPLGELLWQQAGWPSLVPVNLMLSVLMAALSALAYWQTLGPLGRLLQRRETKILGVVTVEVE